MADAEQEVVKQVRVTLHMDEEEAGYLLNALGSHIAGSLVSYNQPLGKVRTALKDAGVQEIKAWRVKGIGDYAAIYATQEEIPENRRYEATQR